MAANIIADRTINWDSEKTVLLEADDPRQAWVAFHEGCEYTPEEVEATGATWNGEALVLPDADSAPKAKAKSTKAKAEKPGADSAPKEETKPEGEAEETKPEGE